MSKQSEALRQYFFMKGIRNKDIAEALGINPASVSNMLSGHDSFGYARAHQLQELYGIDATALMKDGEIVEIQDGKRIIHHAENSTITQGDNSPINIVADNSALKAENERLRAEVEWLRSMLEKREK